MRKIYIFTLGLITLLVLQAIQMSAQNASTYLFSPSSGTFTPISGGTAFTLSQLSGETAGLPDDGIAANVPIGFNFLYNSTTFNTFSVTTNGCMSLGASASTAWWGNSLNAFSGTPKINFLAPMWDDNNITGGTLTYALTGTPGSRVLTVEWFNSHIGGTGSTTTATASFQVKLFEGTNVIQFVYGGVTGTFGSSQSISIGITGSAGNFLSVTPAASATASSTTANNSIASATNLTSGTTYTFTPPPPCVAPTAQATSLVLTPAASTVNGTFTAASPAPDKYLVVRTPGTTALNTAPVNGTVYTANSTLGNGTVVSYSATTTFTDVNLTSSTQYTYTIFSSNDNCTGPAYNTTAPLTGTTSTSATMAYTWNATSGSADATLPGSWTPARNTPDITDTLYFTQGGTSTISNLSTMTVAKLAVSNNTTIVMNSAAAATLSVSYSMSIAAGSTVELGGSNNLTLNYVSGNNPTGNIAGTLTLNGSGTISFNTTNSVTNVSGTINVASGTSSVTGSAASLFMNAGSNYNHARNGGSSPAATYAPTSNFNVTGIIGTGLTPPAKVGNITWDCPSQTVSAYSWGSSVDTIRGNFNVISTGTGSFQLGAGSGTITTVVGDFNQTGGTMIITGSTNLLRVVGTTQLTSGTLNFSSSTGTGTLIALGNLNQAAGHTITETSSGTAVINFNGTIAQTAAFNGTLTNSIGYAINNTAGVALSGTPLVNSGAGVTITSGSFSGTPFTYASSSNTLTYNGSNAQTTSDFEFPATSGPTALTINNTSATGVTLHAARTVTSGFTLTAGRLNTTATNLLTLASTITSPPAGSATAYVNGPLAIEVNTAANATRNWAVGDANGGRPIQLAAFHTGGSIATFIGESVLGNAGGSGLTTMNTTRYFRLTNISAIQSTTTPTIRLSYGGDDIVPSAASAVIGQAATSNGIYTNLGQSANTSSTVTSSTTTPLSASGGEYFIIGSNSPIKTWDGGASTNNWTDANNWNPNGVPVCTDDVFLAGTSVVINLATSSVANNLTVSSGITLNAPTGTSLTLGCAALTGGNKMLQFNSGATLNMTGGNIHVNGGVNFASGSTFNQSAGLLSLDPNDGTAAGSLNTAVFSTATTNIKCTGGTIRIIDPLHVANTSSTYAFTVNIPVTTDTNFGGTHTIEFGDGISTTPGGTNGFRIYSFQGAGYAVYNNIVVNGGNGTGRFVVNSALALKGNLTINANSQFRQGAALYATGNIINNGLFATNSTTTFGVQNSNYTATAASTISGTGTWKNRIPTVSSYTAAGSGYVLGDVVTLNGGTFTTAPATFIVTGVNGTGGITAATVQNFGDYTVVPTNPVSLTGGTGSGATFTMQSTATNAGYLIPSANLIGITVNNNNLGVSLTSDVSFSGTVTFTNGKVYTGANKLIEIAGASNSGAGATAGWVVGTYQKAAATGSMSNTYPIGDSTDYAPVTVSGGSGAVTTAGDIAVKTTKGDHPNIGTSTIQPSNSVNRYYTISALNGITFAANALNVTLNWVAADLDPGATTASFIVGKYDGSTWTYPTVASPGATSIQATGISSFSDFIVGSTTPLAIKLVNIAAKNVGTANHVNWQTAAEEAGDAFELERSTDGNEFNKIASVNAKGAASTYTYVDEAPAKGINYYRLKMINSNGRSEYSKIVQAIVSGKDAFVVRAYPNPVVDNKLTVEVTGAIAKNAVITVTDVTGKIVRMVNVTNNKTDIDMSSATSGIYFVKYMDAEQSHTMKVTK